MNVYAGGVGKVSYQLFRRSEQPGQRNLDSATWVTQPGHAAFMRVVMLSQPERVSEGSCLSRHSLAHGFSEWCIHRNPPCKQGTLDLDRSLLNRWAVKTSCLMGKRMATPARRNQGG